MRIGILTVHRAYNYGSVLQCFALQEYLKSQGHVVSVIDYRQPWTESVYKVFSFGYVWHFLKKGDLHAIVAYWRTRRNRKKELALAKEQFSSFNRRINLSKPCRYRIPQDYDCYIIGSDQLWSHSCVGGEDRVYLGHFNRPKGSRLIGFSLSASEPSLALFGPIRLKQIIRRFNSISFREQTGKEKIKAMTGIDLTVTIDPTLLSDGNIWEPLINQSWASKKYLAVYQARPVPYEPTYLIDKATILARKLNCDVVDLSGMTESVEDFISAIKYAQYIMTTSFHATVFSVLMETKCFAIELKDGFDLRYVDLLKSLGLSKELFQKDFIPTEFDVDFTDSKIKLEQLRLSTKQFLKEVLS